MSNQEGLDTKPLIRCDNEECRNLSTELQLKKNKGNCPYCGKRIKDPYALNKLHNLLSQITILDVAKSDRQTFVDWVLESVPANRRKDLKQQAAQVWDAAKAVLEATKPWK
jgi:hypothetical protein